MDNLPHQLQLLTAGYAFDEISHGCSAAQVFRLTKPDTPSLYLKIHPNDTTQDLADEHERLLWMQRRLPAPEVRAFIHEDNVDYLLMSEAIGTPAHEYSGDAIKNLVRILAEGLRMLHSLDIDDCPFDHSIARDITRAEELITLGLVDESDFDEKRKGRSAQDLFDEMLTMIPSDEDRVFTHGDYCLPNIMIAGDAIGGFIDVGRAGIGDRYRDLSLAAGSLALNFGEEWVPLLFSAYGLDKPDEATMEFFRLMDEFF